MARFRIQRKPRRERSRLVRLLELRPDELWYVSIELNRNGHRYLALALKGINTFLYHNFLAPGASVGPEVHFAHSAFGVMIHYNVEIGARVKIWHHVTLTAPAGGETPGRVVIEDDVRIGALAVVIAPRGKTLTIGRGARIGAGVVVTEDVPPGATVVADRPRVLAERAAERLDRLDRRAAERAGDQSL